jgi:anaerobic ribonucleoside-triphosphate reductase
MLEIKQTGIYEGFSFFYCRKCAKTLKLGMNKKKKVTFDWTYQSMELNGVEYIRREDVDKLLDELSEVRLKCIEKITLSEKKTTWVRRKD